MTRQAFALDRIAQHPFPAEGGVEAVDAPNNQDTLQNIRLWDWRALQDTLRQIQEIRTYYDFPDIDIDRYEVNGSVRQMMLAARELNVDKLPESSRNWINEKLIYTHGYGVTMNPVNGFTPEGLPALILQQHAGSKHDCLASKSRGRKSISASSPTPTSTCKTRQKEFNYPQGETNSLTSYEGNGGILLGGFFRRLIIALDRGDLAKLPFSDDVTRGEPAADAPQHPRARRHARALPHLRRGPLRHRRRRWPALVDDGRLHDVRVVSRTRGISGWVASASTTCATA